MDRKLQRHALDVRVSAEPTAGPAVALVSGRMRDLSEGGFGATFTRALREGDLVKVSFLLGSAQTITVEAVVRYVRGFRHGLEFREISRAERLTLWKLCQKSEHVH